MVSFLFCPCHRRQKALPPIGSLGLDTETGDEQRGKRIRRHVTSNMSHMAREAITDFSSQHQNPLTVDFNAPPLTKHFSILVLPPFFS